MCMKSLCSEEPAKSTSSHTKHPKDAASPATSGQGLGTLTGSGLINKHFMPVMPPFTTEEHKRAYALMIRAHSAAILPPSINDIPEFREYLEYISRGGYAIPHRTKTTEIEDAAVIEVEKKVPDSFWCFKTHHNFKCYTLHSEGPPPSWNLGISTSICSVAMSMTCVLCMHKICVYMY